MSYDPPVSLAAADYLDQLKMGVISEANKAAANIFECDETDIMQGKTISQLFSHQVNDKTALNTILTTFAANKGQPTTSNIKRQRKDGSPQYLRQVMQGDVINGHLHRAWGVTTDMTDLRQAQERLQRANKMDAIGQLTGGIAHEFNNTLGGILGAAELLNLKASKDPEMLRLVEIIIGATERARELNRKLLIFSR